MARPSSPPDPLPDGAEAFAQALENKRQQLDQEVAAFAEEKEKEYKHYEAKLRRHTAFDNPHNDQPFLSSGATKVVGRKDLVEQKTEKTCPIEAPPTDKVSINKEYPSASNATPTYEQETEFRSLFVPSYLPLLEDPHRGGNGNKRVHTAHTPSNRLPSLTSSLLSSPLNLAHTTVAHKSASQTFSSEPSLASPLHVTPSQSSLTRGLESRPSLGDRSSSSRSDVSVSSSGLRSAIRQPQSPDQPENKRDKKHVLFHINNMVISPSSSPLLNRQDPTRLERSMDADEYSLTWSDKEAGYFGHVSESDDTGKDGEEDSRTQFKRITPPSSLRAVSPLHQGLMQQQHRLSDLLQPTITTPPVTAREEADFAMNAGSDPLFEFDEASKSEHSDDADDGIDDGDDMGSTFSAHVSNQDGDGDLPADLQSPHVGSLPIEIKWPGKKGQVS